PFTRTPGEFGSIQSINGATVQFRGTPGWSLNQWAYAPGIQTNTYYLLARSGAAAGDYFTILANTPDSLSLHLSGGTINGLAVGDTVAIIPYWTLGTIFPGGQGINESSSPGVRPSEILFPNLSATGINLSAVATYYFWAGAWRQVGQGTAARND